ncbi:phage major capsid protein [Streptomyces sp. NPDC002285]
MATPTVPQNADELEDMLGDTGFLKQFKDQSELGEWIKAYGASQSKTDPGQEQQIRDLVDQGIANALRGDQVDNIHRLNLAPAWDNGGPTNRSKYYNGKAPGAALDKQFSDWGDYLTATWAGSNTQEAFAARSDIKKIQNAFGSTVPSDGGFLIPESLRSELLSVPTEQGVVRSRARVVPMETLMVPYPTIDSTSNATSIMGGVTGYWTEEAGTLTESAPSFGRIELVAKKLTIYSEIPNELYQDSLLSLETFMSQSYPQALLWFEDCAFIDGNGVGQPTGFLNASAAVTVNKESGQTAATILWENIVKMYARMLPSSIGNAVWIVNNDIFPELATMAMSVGTGGSAIWIGDGGGEGTPPMRILGRPVISSEKVPTLGTTGDISFVDLGYYLIGDRQAMQMSTSTEFKFGNDKTAVRVIERVDGTPWVKSAITPRKGANTLSPFVKLQTRS